MPTKIDQMKPSMQKRLEALEADYMIQLIEALKRCAGGKYGLLDQNDAVMDTLNKRLRSRLSSQDAEDLLELGSLIGKLRQQLGYTDAFAPHQRLLKIRSSSHANSPGEPKLARAWLEELS